MGCRIVRGDAGIVVIACGPNAHTARKCHYCSRPHTKLCDFKMAIDGGWKLCSLRLCGQCAVSKGQDIDICRTHENFVDSLGDLI